MAGFKVPKFNDPFYLDEEGNQAYHKSPTAYYKDLCPKSPKDEDTIRNTFNKFRNQTTEDSLGLTQRKFQIGLGEATLIEFEEYLKAGNCPPPDGGSKGGTRSTSGGEGNIDFNWEWGIPSGGFGLGSAVTATGSFVAEQINEHPIRSGIATGVGLAAIPGLVLGAVFVSVLMMPVVAVPVGGTIILGGSLAA